MLALGAPLADDFSCVSLMLCSCTDRARRAVVVCRGSHLAVSRPLSDVRESADEDEQGATKHPLCSASSSARLRETPPLPPPLAAKLSLSHEAHMIRSRVSLAATCASDVRQLAPSALRTPLCLALGSAPLQVRWAVGLRRLQHNRPDNKETCAAAGERLSAASWPLRVRLHSHAHQRRCGEAETVRRPACIGRLRLHAGADAHAYVRRLSEAQRLRGSRPRDAAAWEDNALVTFCRAARTDAAVRKALELLEVRRSAVAQKLLLSADGCARAHRTRWRWTPTCCCSASGCLSVAACS